jgi:1-acyl-sn-glycerol-3-phosphate acyltransferase
MSPSRVPPYRWVGRWPVRLLRRFLMAYLYRLLLAPWLRRFVVEGTATIPPGPVIYAAMHTSMADTPLILRALGGRGDRIVVTAARDFFFRRARPGFGPFVALAFGAVPIDRTGSPRQSLNDVITWLRSGFSVVIYPQGTIPGGAEDEKRLHRGVALLARQSHCPVVPVRIVGAAELLPAGVHWPRPATACITFLPPILHGGDEAAARFTARLSTHLFST